MLTFALSLIGITWLILLAGKVGWWIVVFYVLMIILSAVLQATYGNSYIMKQERKKWAIEHLREIERLGYHYVLQNPQTGEVFGGFQTKESADTILKNYIEMHILGFIKLRDIPNLSTQELEDTIIDEAKEINSRLSDFQKEYLRYNTP